MSAKFPGRPVGKPGNLPGFPETKRQLTAAATWHQETDSWHVANHPKDIPGLWPAFWLLGNLGF